MNSSRESESLAFTEITISSDSGEARKVQESIETRLLSHSLSEKEIFAVRLALEEALVNAIKHGNQMDRAKKIRIAYRLLQDRMEIQIADEGTGFDPADVPDPTAVENLERPCGRGLMLMRYYMTEVNYNDQGNMVSMTKVFRMDKQEE